MIDRMRELSCGCRYDAITGEITEYGDYCLIAKAIQTLTEACYRAIDNEDGELAGIAVQGLIPLLDTTSVGYGHENFGDIWNSGVFAVKTAWQVWKDHKAPHWVGEAPKELPDWVE